MERPQKILLICTAASGHLNPFICFASELAKNKNVKLIMYNNKLCRKTIESANIEFREADLLIPKNQLTVKELRKNMPIHKFMELFIEDAEHVLSELIRCVVEEDIDLIVYDLMTVYAKWLLKHLQVKYEKGEIKKPPPKAITFMPMLAQEKGVYPNTFEEKFMIKPSMNLKLALGMLGFFVRYISFCFRYSLKIENPFEVVFTQKEALTLCCVAPEFQPRSHLFPKSIKFVGACAAEEVRGEKEFAEPLKSFLGQFPERNPLPLIDMKVDESKLQSASQELIYISLGTIVNTELDPFLRLIDGVKAINRAAKGDRFKFLMSVGEICHEKLQALVQSEKLQVPDNLLIMAKVPQLDVLKRASLFVTHSGQGSTSESIHYGVPMVCIPVMGDQPAVAYRVATELGLGVELNFDDYDGEAVKNAVMTVLNDKAYLERTILFSQISRKYNGSQEASRITLDFLQSLSKKSN